MNNNFDVVIIGGGATGTSVLRDLSMRGLKTALIEKKLIASGTTSTNHQNLVSGMRYVVKDPAVAKECAEENKILAGIVPQLITETRNYFVGFKNQYTRKALINAQELGLKFREIDKEIAFREIPNLSRKIELVIETEDRNINTSGFCLLNCKSARRFGGRFIENTQISKVIKENDTYVLTTNGGKFRAKYVVNATGPWINTIAKKVGVSMPMVYSQGTIIIMETISPRGLQFFHEPSDGDAYIIHGKYAWLGTTSTMLDKPELARPEKEAQSYLLNKFSEILPKVCSCKIMGKFVGVRPLLKEDGTGDGRKISRSFKIIENPKNFFHIVGGKFTTARLMAEKITDLICQKEDLKARCRTKEKLS